MPEQAKLSKLIVTLAGKPLQAKGRIENGRAKIDLDAEVVIQAGESLKLDIFLNETRSDRIGSTHHPLVVAEVP